MLTASTVSPLVLQEEGPSSSKKKSSSKSKKEEVKKPPPVLLPPDSEIRRMVDPPELKKYPLEKIGKFQNVQNISTLKVGRQVFVQWPDHKYYKGLVKEVGFKTHSRR